MRSFIFYFIFILYNWFVNKIMYVIFSKILKIHIYISLNKTMYWNFFILFFLLNQLKWWSLFCLPLFFFSFSHNNSFSDPPDHTKCRRRAYSRIINFFFYITILFLILQITQSARGEHTQEFFIFFLP